jgi:CsoR family transcriptional regulator, copper-sensing transcriptional repressor
LIRGDIMKSDEKKGHSCPVCESGEETSDERMSHHDDKTVKELINRMNRIEGQIRGIKGMIERHVYCDDVLNQISSAQSALDGAARLLLEKHMKSCVKEQLENGETEVIDEVLKTIFRMIR